MPAPRPNTLFFGAKYREGGILHAACARTVDQEKACLTQTGYIHVERCTDMGNSALLPDFFPFKSGHMVTAKVAIMILFHGDGILSRFKTVNFRLEKRRSACVILDSEVHKAAKSSVSGHVHDPCRSELRSW